MNDTAGYFFFNRYTGFIKTPSRKLLLYCIVSAVCILSSLVASAQDYQRLIEAAEGYYENEQFHSAAQYYQVAVGLRSDQAQPNYHLAQSYRAIFNYPLAAIYFEKSLALDPVEFPLSLFYLAQMQKATGRFSQALQNFTAFISANQNNQMLNKSERESFLAQAAIEKEGCLWAIEQGEKSWKQVGFTNLPEPVNSEYNDYAAAIGNSDSSITITSGRKGVKGGLLDNRYGDYFTDNVRFTKKESWQRVPGSDRFEQTNTKFSDGAGTYNSGKDKYYFTSCYEGNAYCQLYVTQMIRGQWRAPKLLNSNINAVGYDNRHPALSPGGDTLIFVSNRPGGKGANDLWFSANNGEDDWQPAHVMPGNVNTPFNEAAPFFHPQGVLFFSSDGHIGMGGLDIFMTIGWGDPLAEIKNLGMPFNSGYDDNFVSVGSRKGYLSSNRLGGVGKFDVYSFDIPDETEDLIAFFEDPGPLQDQLSSRIRDYGNSNLFAARDEDQFYYDNLTAAERAHFDRILAAKRKSEGNFDPRSLASEDFRYYRKLDIETKAVIERLAQRKALELQTASGIDNISLDLLQQSDLDFYENASEEERAIIDRIINAKIEDRQNLLGELAPDESNYWNSDLNNAQDRIEARAQIRSIDSVLQDIHNSRDQTAERLQLNEGTLREARDVSGTSNAQTRVENILIDSYHQVIEILDLPHKLFYQELSPAQRDDLHRLALRQAILGHEGLSSLEKQEILREFQLTDEIVRAVEQASYSPEKRVLASGIVEALQRGIPLTPDEGWSEEERRTFNELTISQLVARTLSVHQELLKSELAQSDANGVEMLQMQEQLGEKLSANSLETSQHQSIEESIARRIAEKYLSFVPRKLQAREAFYFRGLKPGNQLRLDRLSRLLKSRVAQVGPASSQPPGYLFLAPPESVSFFNGLTVAQQKVANSIISQGVAGNLSYDSQQERFLQQIDQAGRDHMERLIMAHDRLQAGLVPETATSGAVTVKGQIKELDSKNAAEHLVVALMDGQGKLISTDTTDQKGNFQFENIDPQADLWIRPLNEDVTQPSAYSINDISTSASPVEPSFAEEIPQDQPFVEKKLQDMGPNSNLVVEDIMVSLNEEDRQRLISMMESSQKDDLQPVPSFDSSEPVSVTGFIKDPQTGSDLTKVLVALFNDLGQVVALDTADHKGQFQFHQIDPQGGLQVLPLSFLQDRTLHPTAVNISVVASEREVQQDQDLILTDKVTPEHDEPVIGADPDNQDQKETDRPKTESPHPKSPQMEEFPGPIIYFDFDRFQLRTEARKTLEELANYLNAQSGQVQVLIAGHTDYVGPDNYNNILSEKRSNSTFDYLQRISPQVLATIKGYGERQPMASNRTAFGRQFNRRVEIKLQGPGERPYLPGMRTYLIKPGASLNSVARAAGVSEELLMQWNGLIQKTLRPYQPLRLPSNISFVSVAPLVFDPLGEESAPGDVNYHIVKYGETLFRLAQKYGTTVQALEMLNGVEALDLKAGQRLRVR